MIGTKPRQKVKEDNLLTQDRLRIEQVAAVIRNVSLGVAAAACAAIVLGATFIQLGVLPLREGVIWMTWICTCAYAHIALRRAYDKATLPTRCGQGWGMAFAAIAFAEGIGWGWLSIAVAPSIEHGLDMVALTVILAVAAGSIPAFGSYLPAFAAIFLPTTLPFAVWSALAGGLLHATEAGLMVIFIAGMGGLGVQFNRNFSKLVTLRLERERLAEDLLRQRDLAEQANQAKSQFLAAASHDLRQPVHALGLFVGALRGVAMPKQAVQLLDQIEASVMALDDLFSALLDVSRLDAGIVQVRSQAFPIQPLLTRIVRDFEAEASGKSIGLVLWPSSINVETDPLLLERILRNIIANAIRYTDHGRVVVGCRRGRALRVQVWDTGRGIPADQKARIFQEFYQIENQQRDRSKGLGLGLAIVRRLTDLLACPLDVQSTLGRGSCFSVTVPVAREAPHWEPTVVRSVGALQRGFVVVIDDEMPIQQAMYSLLTSWGHEVIAVSSGDAAMKRLASHPARPDLIIADYRLPNGETGIKSIQRLRAEYNAEIPAMLITGDTAPDRLIEASRSGFLLLHKPVTNSQLRAAIGNLMKHGAPDAVDD